MDRTNVYKYYAFGFNYFLLWRRSTGIPIHGGKGSLSHRIDKFLREIEELDLRVTLRAAKQLTAIRADLKKEPADAAVSPALAKEVEKAVGAIDATLDAELQLKEAYTLAPRRIDVHLLVEAPHKLLAKGVYRVLPMICQFDFAQAGRCIAFGLPTAAAFHLMRSAEGLLRAYYCSIVKRGRVPKLMWYDMLVHLRKRRDAPPAALLDHLDHIRTNFRNPTQHPDARYDLDEAQDLFLICVDSLNRMIRDLETRGLGNQQLPQ